MNKVQSQNDQAFSQTIEERAIEENRDVNGSAQKVQQPRKPVKASLHQVLAVVQENVYAAPTEK